MLSHALHSRRNITTKLSAFDPAVDPLVASSLVSTTPLPYTLAHRTQTMEHMLKGTAKELITAQRGGTLVFRCPVKACNARLKQSSTLRDFHMHTASHANELHQAGCHRCVFGCPSMQSLNGTTMHLSVVTHMISQCQKVNVVVACATVPRMTPTHGRSEVNTCC